MFVYKDVPVKWHRFVQFVLIPVFILIGLVSVVSMIAELFSLESGLPKILAPLFQLTGTTVTSMGDMFWPVILIVLCDAALIVLRCFAFAGFLRWEKYGKNCWNLSCFAVTVFSLINYLVYEKAIGMADMNSLAALFEGSYENAVRNINTLFGLGRAFYIVGIILLLIISILNAAYYQKRKALFVGKTSPSVPEVPAETPAAAASEEAWTCEMCGTANTGLFCTGCGAPKPAVPVPAEVIDETETVTETGEEDTETVQPSEMESVSPSEIPMEETEPAAAAEESEPLVPEDTVTAETELENPAAEEMAEPEPEAAETAVMNESTMQAEEVNAKRICPNCGKEIDNPEMRFCRFCGKPLA